MNRFLSSSLSDEGPSVIPIMIRFYCVAVISFWISGSFSFWRSLFESEYSSSFNSSEKESELDEPDPLPPPAFDFSGTSTLS